MSERQTAIVTGAGSGIGRAMTLGLLREGLHVAGVDREAGWLDELAGAARGLAGRFTPVRADLAEPGACDAAVDTAARALGRIDVLVNNAGVGQASVRADQRRNPIRFWEVTPEQWARFLAVNATAPLMMARAVAPLMMRAGKGRIVTVTTSLGSMIRAGYALYGASKAAAEAGAAVMAADLAGTGVTVNVLVPGGMTDTRIIGEGEVADRTRLIRPEAMVPPLLWLISDAGAEGDRTAVPRGALGPSLPAAQAAATCGAPIAWTSIATMPIETD